MKPSKTLFVINFDTYNTKTRELSKKKNTKTRDLEKHFEPYGKIGSVRIQRNFAFVQYEYQEDAVKALEATHMSKLMDQVISVEYASRDDDEKKGGYSPRGRSRDMGDTKRCSLSPYRRERGSPDYGRGPNPIKRERGSPDYGHDGPASKHTARGSRSPTQRERDVPDRSQSRSHGPYGKDYWRVGHFIDAEDNPYGKRVPEPEPNRDCSASPSGEAHEKRGSRAQSAVILPQQRTGVNRDSGRNPTRVDRNVICQICCNSFSLKKKIFPFCFSKQTRG